MSVLDPLHGTGYEFWSGIGGNVSMLAGLVALGKHLNCHEKGCWRFGHKHPNHGFPVCRRHYHRPLRKPVE